MNTPAPAPAPALPPPHNRDEVEQVRELFRRDAAGLRARKMHTRGFIVHMTGDFHAVRFVDGRYQLFGGGRMVVDTLGRAEKIAAHFNAAGLSATFVISSPEQWRVGRLAFVESMLDKLPPRQA